MTCWFIFECSTLFEILDYNILPYLIDLHSDLAEQNLRTEVFGLTSNVSKNGWSDFLALGLFTVTDWIVDIGLFPVNTSGVDTIADKRMALYCCWSSHFPYYLNNFLILSGHICSYIALLLNDWSTPTVTIHFSVVLTATTL